MSVEYLDLADFLLIAEEVTGLDIPTLSKVARLSLADSALHAPSAGFGDADMYPDFRCGGPEDRHAATRTTTRGASSRAQATGASSMR